MSSDGPTSPDDPEWVDEIVRRALERAGADDAEAPPVAAPNPAPAQRVEPQAMPPDPQPTQPVAEPRPAPEPQPVQRAPEPQSNGTTAAPVPHAAPQPERLPADTRLPTEDDLVSAYPIGDTSQPAVIAGTQQARPRTSAESPYPGAPLHDDLDQARFDEAVGSHIAEPAELDPIGGRMRGFLEWGAVVVGALAVALLIKTFLMQAYFIPSSSMEPTLQVGDRVLVNKLSYNFGDVGRGDLVVFNRPPNQPDGEDDLIKRVIALPGEVIEIRDGEVFITTVDNPDQQQLVEPYLPEGTTTTGLVNTDNCVNAGDPTRCEIPDGHIFVMGDNRIGSRDSRVFGPIEDDLVVGRAFLRVWPLGDVGFL